MICKKGIASDHRTSQIKKPSFISSFLYNTVKPLYNGHCWDQKKSLLYRAFHRNRIFSFWIICTSPMYDLWFSFDVHIGICMRIAIQQNNKTLSFNDFVSF